VKFTIKEDAEDTWSVCRNELIVGSRMALTAAVREAVRRAREYHHSCGEHVVIELEIEGQRSVIGEHSLSQRKATRHNTPATCQPAERSTTH
jgi:hypothetical protein